MGSDIMSTSCFFGMGVNKLEERPHRKRIVEVFERHWGMFLRYVQRRAHDISQMDAEDIVEEVLVNLLSRPDQTDEVQNLSAYIYRSLANYITDLARRRLPSASLDAINPRTESPMLESIPDNRGDIDALLSQQDMRQRLHEAISRLDPKQRAVWLATEVQGRSFRELSREWNEPIGTLLSRKSRATKALREHLGDLT